MANGSGGKTTATEAAPPVSIECSAACDTCRSAPGIPFCRVEWSFLCAGCASVVHGNNWVVAVTPNLNPNPSPSFPPPNPSSDTANPVVHLSSDEEGAAGPRGRRRSGGRVESVMRYRQKRKNRTFEKTVRYANRKTNAELMPRADGKFARKEGVGPDAGVELMGMDAGEEMEPDWAEELGAEASDNDAGHPEIRLQ